LPDVRDTVIALIAVHYLLPDGYTRIFPDGSKIGEAIDAAAIVAS